MRIKEIKNKKSWDEFLTRKELGFFPFFQSWNFGEVQKKVGHDVLRIGILNENNKLVGIASIVDIQAKRGYYLHLRHGPVLLKFSKEYFKKILDFVKIVARKKGASFIRVSPLIKKELVDKNFFKKMGFINAPIHNMDAETCLVLDINKSEEELLKGMRKTHRYLIKKAQNMNIKVKQTKKISDLDKFLCLYSDLSKRKNFIPHKDIKEEFEIFTHDDQAVLFLAEYNEKIIAGAFIVFVDDMAIYRHGASRDGFRDIPCSYRLQWEAILEAKKRGKKFYNFWGIAPSDSKNHPWQGLTLFKTGFGGGRQEFLHAQDLPLNIWYWKTYFIETLTKWRKGY